MKILPNNIAVIEGDTHISAWVEQTGKLCHDETVEKHILPLIKPGQTVIDAGANIGDHTVAYMHKVGVNGLVYAFEPHDEAHDCLQHNVINSGAKSRFYLYRLALSDRVENVHLYPHPAIPGASHIGGNGSVMQTATLDQRIGGPVHFIKIDCEGYDFFVLRGAIRLLMKFRPIVLIEMNRGHMSRYGVGYFDVLTFLEAIGYGFTPLLLKNKVDDEQYDLLCTP